LSYGGIGSHVRHGNCSMKTDFRQSWARERWPRPQSYKVLAQTPPLVGSRWPRFFVRAVAGWVRSGCTVPGGKSMCRETRSIRHRAIITAKGRSDRSGTIG